MQRKDSKTYKSWSKMRERCNNPNTNRSKSYYEKGITYCKEWDDYLVFLRDMGERPNGTSLDRIDNNKGYYKENCRWATPKEQAINTSRNVFYSICGVLFCQEDAKIELNVTIKKLRYMRAKNTLPYGVEFIGRLSNEQLQALTTI